MPYLQQKHSQLVCAAATACQAVKAAAPALVQLTTIPSCCCLQPMSASAGQAVEEHHKVHQQEAVPQHLLLQGQLQMATAGGTAEVLTAAAPAAEG